MRSVSFKAAEAETNQRSLFVRRLRIGIVRNGRGPTSGARKKRRCRIPARAFPSSLGAAVSEPFDRAFRPAWIGARDFSASAMQLPGACSAIITAEASSLARQASRLLCRRPALRIHLFSQCRARPNDKGLFQNRCGSIAVSGPIENGR